MSKKIEFLHSGNHDVSGFATNLNIAHSSSEFGWDGVIVEEGSADLFCPDDAVVAGHYFAMLLSDHYNWEAKYDGRFRQLETQRGQIWVNPKDQSFSHRVTMYNEFGLVLLSDERLRAAIGEYSDLRQIVFERHYNANDVQLQNLLQILLTEIRQGNPNQKIFVDSIVNALALHYLHHYSNFKAVQDLALGQHKLHKIIDFIRQRLEDNLELATLAAQFNLSQTTLINSFKRELNTTPHLFVLNEKLNQAARWLKASSWSLGEIAFKLNFSDQSHFTRLFKARFGVTPLKFREAQRK